MMRHMFYCSLLVVITSMSVAYAAPVPDDTQHHPNGNSASMTVATENVKLLTSQIERDPNDWHAFIERAKAHFVLGNDKPALEDLNEAIKLNPESDDAIFLRGNLYESLSWPMSHKDFKDAEQLALADYNRALEINPDFIKALSARACLSLHRQDYESFLIDRTKSLEIKGDIEVRKEIFHRLILRSIDRLDWHCKGTTGMAGRHFPKPEFGRAIYSDIHEAIEVAMMAFENAKLAWPDPEDRLRNVGPGFAETAKRLFFLCDFFRSQNTDVQIVRDRMFCRFFEMSLTSFDFNQRFDRTSIQIWLTTLDSKWGDTWLTAGTKPVFKEIERNVAHETVVIAVVNHLCDRFERVFAESESLDRKATSMLFLGATGGPINDSAHREFLYRQQEIFDKALERRIESHRFLRIAGELAAGPWEIDSKAQSRITAGFSEFK